MSTLPKWRVFAALCAAGGVLLTPNAFAQNASFGGQPGLGPALGPGARPLGSGTLQRPAAPVDVSTTDNLEDVLKKLSLPGYRGPEFGVVDLGSTITLGQILRRNETIQRPLNPSYGAKYLEKELKTLESECALKLGSPSCQRARDLNRSLTSMRDAISLHPDCSAAADAYLGYYPKSRPPASIAARFDLACLGSYEPRAQGGSYSPDIPPAILARSSTSALAAVGLLEDENGPFCAGLLRNDRTLITARHCFEGARNVAWTSGKVWVRPADGRAAPWPVAPRFKDHGSGQAVEADWAVVEILTTDAIAAPATNLRQEAAAGPVSLVAYFDDHKAADYGPAVSSAPSWRKGLRWPREGFCQVYREEKTKCVKLLCQTVEGFSGTPVFMNTTAADQPLQVIGFISRPSMAEDAACGVRETYVTTATASSAVRP
ncbi:hypothetical protein Cseg_0908 [Caulobacter segnis ATCC 21756]|uniref:Peptidase S1 domain-containing protein n=1 Tax=Caulobacter segnis (strain ATCC 21756 / DSM 7131 / JCM 7823 / NBRC 15250 / LMG 17158 / TK0059) TaxID=509190 RepID=D5VEZ6_CAUST|nr:hypothetical protein Cseg_0908 [Caulobacter segnis ATCC 21756]